MSFCLTILPGCSTGAAIIELRMSQLTRLHWGNCGFSEEGGWSRSHLSMMSSSLGFLLVTSQLSDISLESQVSIV